MDIGKDLRHESCGEGLEEESDKSHQGREVSSKTAAERKETGNEGNGSEEESNQVESKHEARQVVVHVGTDELLGDVLLGAKVSRRVEWQRGDRRAAVGIVAGVRVGAADGEEGPSRWVSCVGDAAGGGFEEVELGERSLVDAASEDGQELEEQTSSDQDQRAECEKRSWKVC